MGASSQRNPQGSQMRMDFWRQTEGSGSGVSQVSLESSRASSPHSQGTLYTQGSTAAACTGGSMVGASSAMLLRDRWSGHRVSGTEGEAQGTKLLFSKVYFYNSIVQVKKEYTSGRD